MALDLTETIIAGIEQILQKLVELGPTIVYVLIALAVAFVAIKIVQHFVRKFFERVDFNEDIEHLLTKAVGWALWFFVLMWLVGQLGLDRMFESLLAVGALGGLAVALAVKDSLKDVVAGILILKDRHFDLHDVVKIGSAQGEIIDVSLRKTRILQEDGSILILPNSKIDSGGWQFVKRHGKSASNFASGTDIKQYFAKEKARMAKLRGKIRK